MSASSIYLHIPFCRKACHYCDFHFSTSLAKKKEMLSAIMKEMRLRKDYLPDKRIATVYFGGGTPSLLNAEEINGLIDIVSEIYAVESSAEVTLEANPDDVSASWLKELKKTPVNRLSIGIQSFFDEDLQYMNRTHNAGQSAACVKRAQDSGYENITLDLIYGFPLLSDRKWQENLQQVFELQVPHLSCYSLTVEPRTALAHFVKKGRTASPDDEQSARQFTFLMDKSAEAGYIQYEISNFAKPGCESRHNSAYWKGIPYAGFGPSAHSYDGESRQWNVANNELYMRSVETGGAFFEREFLSEKDKLNEYILTGLRAAWGVDENKLQSTTDGRQWKTIKETLIKLESEGMIMRKENIVTLTGKGKLFADKIAAGLFI